MFDRYRKTLLRALFKYRPNVAHALKDPNNAQRTGLGIVDHDVLRVALNRPESKRKVCQIFAHMPAQRPFGQKRTRLVEGRLNPIGRLYAVAGDVIPNFEQITFRLRCEAVEAHRR
jgi:hypothetical protein